MKAWRVNDNNCELGTMIVFAETRSKAMYIALQDDIFEDYTWTEIYAKRFKEYDQFYDGKSRVDFWNDDEHRIRLVRDFGWSCIEVFDDLCEECPAKQWCEEYKGGMNNETN